MKDITSASVGKLDTKKKIDGKRFVLIKKGTKIKRGTVPGGENHGEGGIPEVMLPDGHPPTVVSDFLSF